MKGGHNRKPTRLKVIEGTIRADRMRNEPKPAAAVPTCPTSLPAAAKTEWRRLVRELNAVKLLARIDRDALADLALCIVRLRQAEKEISENGLTIVSAKGELRRNPALISAREYRQALRSWSEKFGLSPADRGRLDVRNSEPKPKDPAEKYFND